MKRQMTVLPSSILRRVAIVIFTLVISSTCTATDISDAMTSFAFDNYCRSFLHVIKIASESARNLDEAGFLGALDELESFRTTLEVLHKNDSTDTDSETLLLFLDGMKYIRLEYLNKPFCDPIFYSSLPSGHLTERYVLPLVTYFIIAEDRVKELKFRYGTNDGVKMEKEQSKTTASVKVPINEQKLNSSAHSGLPTIGEKVIIGYFEICINNVHTDTKLRIGNMFLDEDAGQGNRFFILDVTFRCIDKESRMPVEGSLFMNVEGRMYEFDNTETVMADGWGLFFDQLNPLTSKTTKIVYKIPSDVKGDVFWEPGRNPDKSRFYCGSF